jgi:membrane-associated protease RseP (regulator of RpoE activity)
MTLGLRVVAQMLLMLTSIAVYGALGALHTRGGVLTSIVLVALLTFVAILGHELAHAAAARLVGARIHAIVAFPLRLRFRPRRLDLIKRGGHRGDLGGYVSYTLDRIDARRKRATIAAAGPLANLVLALLAGTMVPWFDRPLPPLAIHAVPGGAVLDAAEVGDLVARIDEARRPTAPIILFAFAILSGGLGLANLIPYAGSDGDHIIALWRRRTRGQG